MISSADSLTVGIVIEDLSASGAPWNYIKTLPEKLAEHGTVTPLVLYRRGDASRFSGDVDTLRLSQRRYPTPWLPDRPFPIRLSAVERRRSLDLIHLNAIPDLGHLFAWEAAAPVVATVHGTLHWADLPIHTQERSYRRRRRWLDRLGRYTLDYLLAVSDHVRDFMVERAGYRPQQVMTTYEAIDDSFFSLPASEGLDNVPETFLLHVSNAAPKKNIETLLSALERLHATGRPIDLVIAGDRWRPHGPKLAAARGVGDHVHFLGYVSQERLVHLYDEALCFVYPSYHETFGLPNVEAMARGTPIVTTAAYAIPEIVGDAAVTVDDPDDVAALADAIRNVIDDEALRSRLIKNGERRAQRFRWDSHCERLVEAYQRILTERCD